MTAVARGNTGAPLCPRCGASLQRQHRHLLHRLVSVVYPIRLYACTPDCGWRGMLPSVTTLARRRRQVRLVLAALLLVAVLGLLAWRYAGELLWSPARSPLNEGFEESSGAQ